MIKNKNSQKSSTTQENKIEMENQSNKNRIELKIMPPKFQASKNLNSNLNKNAPPNNFTKGTKVKNLQKEENKGPHQISLSANNKKIDHIIKSSELPEKREGLNYSSIKKGSIRVNKLNPNDTFKKREGEKKELQTKLKYDDQLTRENELLKIIADLKKKVADMKKKEEEEKLLKNLLPLKK